MSQRRAGHSNRCPNCRINHHFCVCHDIHPFLIQTKVTLIVHVRELKLTSNTAQFAQKMLPQNAEIFIRGEMNKPFHSQLIFHQDTTPLFLYPHEDALELNSDFKEKHPGPYQLIIPDGNWQQARKVRKREPLLQNLLTVKLPPNIKGEYQLRKAQHSHWVSTYEAMAHALGVLESYEIKDRLMQFFNIWVDRTLRARRGDFSNNSF